MKDAIKSLFSRFRRVISYGIVGCTNTVVDFAAFTLAGELFGASAALSQGIGYTCGIICSFVLNRRYTFKDGTRRLWGQMALFLAVNLCALALSSWALALLTGAGMNRYIAKIITTLVFTVINFFAYKLLVFRVK
jgi:putative flippase GtrA